MPGIYLTAVLTAIVAVAIFGMLIHKLRLPAQERLLWLAAAIAVPLQPLAFYFVRVPLDHWLAAHCGPTSAVYRWLVTFYAPLTEEPAKLLPLLIPAIRRDIRDTNFVRYALAIGLGFAIGEMGFVAERIARNPNFSALPFYQFGGFVGERLMTCVFHSAFLSVALWRLRHGFARGVSGAMALHWLGNFPITLMAWNVGEFGKTIWAVAVQCWLVLYFIAALALLSRFAFGRLSAGRMLYGQRHCPECGKDYDAPIFALNFGLTRYERCPHCRRWHWTKTHEA
jgi:RsiW-degrading membrane proteinase PrsW (M82 family)